MAAFEYGTVYNMFYLHKENVVCSLLVADDISDRKVALDLRFGPTAIIIVITKLTFLPIFFLFLTNLLVPILIAKAPIKNLPVVDVNSYKKSF